VPSAAHKATAGRSGSMLQPCPEGALTSRACRCCGVRAAGERQQRCTSGRRARSNHGVQSSRRQSDMFSDHVETGCAQKLRTESAPCRDTSRHAILVRKHMTKPCVIIPSLWLCPIALLTRTCKDLADPAGADPPGSRAPVDSPPSPLSQPHACHQHLHVPYVVDVLPLC
jgi:hypothetical protein